MGPKIGHLCGPNSPEAGETIGSWGIKKCQNGPKKGQMCIVYNPKRAQVHIGITPVVVVFGLEHWPPFWGPKWPPKGPKLGVWMGDTGRNRPRMA